jgi:integrase-like protein
MFHGKRHPDALDKAEVERFLTHLAVERNVAASTQNQALSAIVFLYKEVLGRELEWLDNVERAKRPARVPVVDRSRGAGGLGADGRSACPHGGDPLRCRAQAHGVRAPAAQGCRLRVFPEGVDPPLRLESMG